MNRRAFLIGASGALCAASVKAQQSAGDLKTPLAEAKPLLDSPPVLQYPTRDGVSVNWAVNGPAAGWVEYGPTPEPGLRAQGSAAGLVPVSDRFCSARLTNLRPGEKIYYRAVSAPVRFHNAYRIERGEPVASPIHEYTPLPLPDSSRVSFAVINDTHENDETLKLLTADLSKDPCDVTIYNGDVFNEIQNDDQVAKYVLRPGDSAYAATRPLFFVPGNHDHRGRGARDLHRAFANGLDEPALPRCFAVRTGPVALIGLDTGEDKPDKHPVFAGVAAFEPYREAQRDWLAKALKRREIASAPFLVICCHIPLWGTPGANGGDTLEGYGSYAKHAQGLWHPLLAEAKAHVVISGHTHRHRYDEPGAGRPYGQLVGGGPQPARATVIRGRAEGNRLEVTVSGLDGRRIGQWKFEPRAIA